MFEVIFFFFFLGYPNSVCMYRSRMPRSTNMKLRQQKSTIYFYSHTTNETQRLYTVASHLLCRDSICPTSAHISYVRNGWVHVSLTTHLASISVPDRRTAVRYNGHKELTCHTILPSAVVEIWVGLCVRNNTVTRVSLGSRFLKCHYLIRSPFLFW